MRGLTQGWIKAGRCSPVPGFLAVNARHDFRISPPTYAGAGGLLPFAQAGWRRRAWGRQKR